MTRNGMKFKMIVKTCLNICTELCERKTGQKIHRKFLWCIYWIIEKMYYAAYLHWSDNKEYFCLNEKVTLLLNIFLAINKSLFALFIRRDKSNLKKSKEHVIICSNKNNVYSMFIVTQWKATLLQINIKNIKINILFDIFLLIRYINSSYNI